MPPTGGCCGQLSEVLAPLPGVLGHPTPFSGGRSPYAPNDHRLPSANPAGWLPLRKSLHLCPVVMGQ